MPLIMRPTGLGSGIDRDRPDYTVYFGGWDVGSRALFYDAQLDLKAMG